MAYIAELDDGRQQLRYGYANNVLRYWPKVAGVGNVTVSGSATYEVHKPGDGATATPIQSGTATVDNSNTVSLLTATIDCSNTLLWQLNLQEYWVLWTWSYAGTTYTFQQGFDVVRDPWIPTISLNDLIEEVGDMNRRATAQATRLATGRTPEAHAAVIAQKAWGDVWEWLRAKAEGDGDFLPSLILDKESLRRVVVAQAISRIYRAEGGAQDSESRAMATDWATEAKNRFNQMGPLRYSAGDNRADVGEIQGFTVTRMTRGEW